MLVSHSQNYLESEDYCLFTLDCTNNAILINLKIENLDVSFNLDTRSSYSVISENYYIEKFYHKNLKHTNKVFNLYNGDQIVPLGYITCNVIYNNKECELDLYVIKNAVGPPLLGRDFYNLFCLYISTINFLELPVDINSLVKEFNKVFAPGLGTFKQGCISIKLKSKNVSPKFFRARPLPFAIKNKVDLELESLEKIGVITPVNYSPWGTPIVPVLKKDGSVRICGDFKVTVNPYIEIDQYPLPRINELFVKLQGGVHFSKLDLSNAYQQFCLDQSSKELMTISTHKGLYQYNRAPFGIASIPAKFQKIMESLLQGLDGTVVFLDDILITGCNRKEHLIRLKKVLQILQESGLKISLPKSNFFQDQIEYLGFIINKEGLHTSDKKIKAIKDAEQPQNLTQLKSFLGLINYYGSVVPNLATLLHPLYYLLKKDVIWAWSPECDQVFLKIKDLTSAPILVHYNPDLPIMSTDASDYGIGGVLSHLYADGSEKPIAFASRTLSDSEKFSQIEKEGLSIIFSVCKFNQYLYGRKFTLLTDHKALTTIFHPEKAIPQFSANRLRRWAVILSNYQYDIKFVKSEKNYADCLSRMPLSSSENSDFEWQNVDVNFINYFSQNSDFPINFEAVKNASLKDSTLCEVKTFLLTE